MQEQARGDFILVAYADPRKLSRLNAVLEAAQVLGFKVHILGLCAETNSCADSDVSMVRQNLHPWVNRIRLALAGLLGSFVSMELGQWMMPYTQPLKRRLRDKLSKCAAGSTVFIAHWPLANCLDDLPQGTPVVFDLAELSATEFIHKPIWRLTMPGFIKRMEQRLVARADYLTSVIPNRWLPELLPNLFAIQGQGTGRAANDVWFVPNLPSSAALNAAEETQLDKGEAARRRARMLYVGSVRPERGIENAIMALEHLDEEISFDILGASSPSYQSLLERLAERHGVANRVSFLGAFPSQQLVSRLKGYGCSFVAMGNQLPQMQFAQPNKLFQSIAAGVPVVVSPGTLIAEQLNRTQGFGYVAASDAPKDLAKAIKACFAGAHSSSLPGNLGQFVKSDGAISFQQALDQVKHAA